VSDERDLVLAILATGDVPSRTMLQKLVYLLGRFRGERIQFAPHLYGPYSPGVQDELERLVAADLVREDRVIHEAWDSGDIDVVQYNYRLTDSGVDHVESLRENLRTDASALVSRTKKVGAWNQAALSMAAKLDLLRQVEPDAANQDVPRLAQEFGWRMTPSNAERGAQLLDALDELRRELPDQPSREA
jgi:uncharacterized protein YwgA